MKKATAKRRDDGLRAEYDLSRLKAGVIFTDASVV